MSKANQPSRRLDYPASAYDDQFILRPPVGMWVTIAFLLRPVVVLVASVTNKADRVGLLNVVYPDRQWAVAHLIAALPGLAVALAYTRRAPNASTTVRWIWRHGRALLLTSLGLSVVFLAFPVLTAHARLGTSALIQASACGLLAYYLVRSPRVGDAFRDFPEAPPPKGSDPES